MIKSRIKNLGTLIKDQNMFIENEEYYVSDTSTLNYLLLALNLKYLYGNILGLDILPQNDLAKAKRLVEVTHLKAVYCLEEDEKTPEVIRSFLGGIQSNKVNARELIIGPFSSCYKKPANIPEEKNEEISSSEAYSNFISTYRM